MAFAIFIGVSPMANTTQANTDDNPPFTVGTVLLTTPSGGSGVVVKNSDSKSYVYDDSTDRCWAYSSITDALENLTGGCTVISVYVAPEPARAPAPEPTERVCREDWSYVIEARRWIKTYDQCADLPVNR